MPVVPACTSPLAEMRPVMTGEEIGEGTQMAKQGFTPAILELWDAWEIHCLILLSLSLQVFLFLFAGMRRNKTSWAIRTLLWLAYLSADSVAIFALGHLAVNASKPRHQIISFWAPFLLVHLGGQDTITAFSKQDNELWTRHLLSLLTQVSVAGYVVAKASWSDYRLAVAMVIMFLSGCFKYAERTWCLYHARPAMLRSKSLGSLSRSVRDLKTAQGLARQSYDSHAEQSDVIRSLKRERIFMMLNLDGRSWQSLRGRGGDAEIRPVADIMSVDAPLNDVLNVVLAADDLLPEMLAEFLSMPGRCEAYEYVGSGLVHSFQRLYTKNPLREDFYSLSEELIHHLRRRGCVDRFGLYTLLLMYNLFQCLSAPVALVLFTLARKGDASRVDVIVSYILLAAAIALDVASWTVSIFSYLSLNLPAGKLRNAVLRIQRACSGKQWSEQVAQYSMVKRHLPMPFLQRWIGKLLGPELFDTKHIRIHSPVKEFILDNLLRSGTRKEWNVSSTRGRLALQKLMRSNNQDSDSAWFKTTGGDIEFPTSVLIWHMATSMCYYYCGNNDSSTDSAETNKHKQVSRDLSNYTMYLIFKCGVMLTTNSQLVHDKVHGEIKEVLKDHQQDSLCEKDAILKLFEPKKKEKQQDSTHQAHKEDANGHLQELLQSTLEALDSPVLPRACALAQELISISDGTGRWGLISAVWSEMLYYTAPRCGGAFHYEHLSTGGEFISHLLLLMHSLGPFLPTPGA